MKADMSKFPTFEEIRDKGLKDPKVKAEYDKLGPRYEIIEQLIRVRLKKGITQKQLAERMGTKQSALARFEAGNTNPTLKFIQKLARALGTSFTLTIT